MKDVGEDDDWTIFWTDYSVSLERVMEMKRFQVCNSVFDSLYQKMFFFSPAKKNM